MSDIIPGIKLIEHNAAGVRHEDDPSLPWKLTAILRPPVFMTMAFVCTFGGSEHIVIRGESEDALKKFADTNDLSNHPRLISLTIERTA